MSRRFGWLLVGLAGVAAALLVAAVLAVWGTGDEGLRAALRATARMSLALFLPVFGASSLVSLTHAGWAKWLLLYRRYLGLSFAVSHTTHLGLIGALASERGEAFPTAAGVVGPGGIAYLLLFAMVATSSDAAQKWLGRRAWRGLHLVGMYALWFVFVYTYWGLTGRDPGNLPLLAALLGVVGLRAAAFARRWRAR